MSNTKSKRPKLIAGNWKMFKLQNELESYFQTLSELLEKTPPSPEISLCLCVPFLLLERALISSAAISKKITLKIAAQNVCDYKEGAFTGEISWPMLQEIGISTSLIGHSERRQYFNETDESIRRKINATKSLGMNAILCIGESKSERESQKTNEILAKQLGIALADCRDLTGIVIAYEPVWAIGTGLVASTDQAQDAHAFIRKWVQERFDSSTAESLHILYGGSVKPDNAKDLLSQSDIDGALIGGASLKASDYASIILAGAK